MIRGEFVVPGEEAVSPRGEEKGRRAELCYSPPPALNLCFKICDLCTTGGVNTHKHTQHMQSFLSPRLGVKGTNCELGIGKSIKQK